MVNGTTEVTTLNIGAISDTHNMQDSLDVGSGDLIIHAGDATRHGSDAETVAFIEWYGQADYKYKVYVPGNHDWAFEEDPDHYIKLCEDNDITVLIDEWTVIEGLKIYGSPYTPVYGHYAFQKPTGLLLQQHWTKIPYDIDILVTHGPPYGVLDEPLTACGDPSGRNAGCYALDDIVRKVQPKVHVFGHIHCGHGEETIDGVDYKNVAVLDDYYCPEWDVTRFELHV